MNAEVDRLGLPRGVWQDLVRKCVPVATRVECLYPDVTSVRFEVHHNEDLVARFTLSFLYGCKGILVSHGMLVSSQYRGQGIGKQLQPIKERVARDLRVSMLLSTVRVNNAPQRAVLEGCHWQQLDTFTNVRTGNVVGVHVKKIGGTL